MSKWKVTMRVEVGDVPYSREVSQEFNCGSHFAQVLLDDFEMSLQRVEETLEETRLKGNYNGCVRYSVS